MAKKRQLARRTVIGVFGVLVLLIGAVPAFDAACAQQALQQRAAQRIRPPQRNDLTTPPPVSSALDASSPLGQALAACDKDAAVQEVFTLPGLKGDLTLDRCYKGRPFCLRLSGSHFRGAVAHQVLC